MPAKPHPSREVVRQVVANHPGWGPERVRDHLEAAARNAGISGKALEIVVPGASTVRRIKREFREEERQDYVDAEWPGTFEAGLLPWEAARVILDITAAGERVSVLQGLWCWRVAQVAEDVPLDVLLQLARELAAPDRQGGAATEQVRSIEFYLALRGWEDEEAYREMLREMPGAPPPWSKTERRRLRASAVRSVADADLDLAEELLEAVARYVHSFEVE